MSASPRASKSSATAGSLIRLVRDQRDLYFALHLARDPCKRGARHHRRDGRDAGLVPADAGVDQCGAGGLDGLAECDHLVPCAAALDEIEHRKPVDDDEIAAHRFARAVDNLDGKADPVHESAAPVVVPEIGLRRDELVDQVAFGTHDFDAVVAGVARKLRAADISGNRLADAPDGQPARTKARDRRAQRGRRNCQRVIGVTAGMQDLQRDLAPRRMDRRRSAGASAPARNTRAAKRAARAGRRNSARCRR
jgi:hypothetical protein